VSEKATDYAKGVQARLRKAGFRVEGDYRGEKLGAKIRDARHELIPYMLVIGPRDAEAGTISVRCRVEGEIGALSLEDTIKRFQTDVDEMVVRTKSPDEKETAKA